MDKFVGIGMIYRFPRKAIVQKNVIQLFNFPDICNVPLQFDLNRVTILIRDQLSMKHSVAAKQILDHRVAALQKKRKQRQFLSLIQTGSDLTQIDFARLSIPGFHWKQIFVQWIPFFPAAHRDINIVFALLIADFLKHPLLQLTIQLLLVFDKAQEHAAHQVAQHAALL
ncbi:hypothetical protein D3C77_455370 [compost metagenome]